MENDNKSIVKYDNTFNKTSLSLLSKVQSDILLSVLSRMGKCKTEKDCYVAEFNFKEIREMVGSDSLKATKIKKVFDALLDTKVEFFTENTYSKANLFSHYELTGTSKAEIILTKHMTDKLIVGANEYTILNLQEYVELPNNYAKELYRMLRQFRHSGMKLIAKDELIKMLKPPKSYNEYDIIRKVILPAIEANKVYFENLNTNIKTNKLPDVVKIMFKPHEQIKSKKFNGNNLEDDETLLEYVRANTQID